MGESTFQHYYTEYHQFVTINYRGNCVMKCYTLLLLFTVYFFLNTQATKVSI